MVVKLDGEPMKLIHFKLSEFECPCCKVQDMDNEFLMRLDAARAIARIPFNITSGYRCIPHNADVGGEFNSRHLLGEAVDIAVTDPEQRALILDALKQAGLTSFALSKEHSFLHVDTFERHWIGIY